MQLVGLSSLSVTLLLLLWNKVFLYSSACSQTHSDSLLSALLQVCASTPCTTSFLHMWRNVLVLNLLAGEMAQWVKYLLCKPEDSSLIPGSQITKARCVIAAFLQWDGRRRGRLTAAAMKAPPSQVEGSCPLTSTCTLWHTQFVCTYT